MTTTYRPPRHERAAARLVTGSVGHGVAGLLDWLEFTTRAVLQRVRRRASGH